MTTPDNRTIDFRKLLEELRNICIEHQTGNAFIVTENNQWAEIRIEKGKITNIKFRNKRGIEALRLLKQVEKARYSFNEGELPQKDEDANNADAPYLPSTFHIFQLLGLDAAAAAPLQSTGTSAKTTTTTVVTTAKKSAEKKIVLVVEDSAISRKVIIRTLSEKNYEIIETEDGFQALAALGNTTPDLVLLDLILPGIDGYKVLAHMKKKPECANIPVIILTSRDTLLDKLRGKMSEADEYLTKPFSPNDLLERVERLLSHEPGYQK